MHDSLRVSVCVCMCVHACNGSNVYVSPFLNSMPNSVPGCAAQQNFPLTNRGKSITSRLREPLSIRRWADSAVPAAEGGREREVGMEMIALQAVKCMAVLRTLCGHCTTRLLNPSVGERDRGGEESARIHAWLVNTTSGSLLSCKGNWALLVSHFLTHTCSLSIYSNTADWQVLI